MHAIKFALCSFRMAGLAPKKEVKVNVKKYLLPCTNLCSSSKIWCRMHFHSYFIL